MKSLITIAICLTTTALLQAQTTIYVKFGGTGNGQSWATACNLETAVNNAISGDQIWVQKGTYQPSAMLTVPDSVKIYGGFAGTETLLSQHLVAANPVIIDGQHKIGSVFRLGKAVELHGLTIKNGNANGNLQGNSQKSGGGIWADENSVISNCIITHNTATLNGGGVYANGKVKMINCVVENNVANGNGSDLFGNCVVLGTDQSSVKSGVDIVGCNPNIPYFGEIGFKTSTIWTISGNDIEQKWSDVVTAKGCDKAYYQGGVENNYYSDCLNNSTYGHLFSWCAVARFAHVLCPAPWRVPTVEDFINLDKALGFTGVNHSGTTEMLPSYLGTGVNQWGGVYGGMCQSNGSLSGQGSSAHYCTQSEYNSTDGYLLDLYSLGNTHPQWNYSKSYGFTLRCVK